MSDYVEAECAIRQLQARYADAVWRFDFDSFGDCFTQGCEWRIDGTILKGREEIVEFNRLMMTTQFRRLLITLRTPILEVGDGTASGRTYFSGQNVLADGTAFAPIGVYYERFVDEGDRWRIEWRLFDTLYSGSPDLSGTFYDQADYGPPPNMPARDTVTASVVGRHREVEKLRRQ